MTEWPADQVERWPIDRLIPYARNARTHSDDQVDQIAASISEWGWTNPVLVDERGTIIAGHGRVLAAQKLGIADCPVMTARGWSEAQRRAYAIADNKVGENAGWNAELLRLEVADLAAMGFDLPLMGFSNDELTALSAVPNPGLTDPDDAPELPADPVTIMDDVWILGRHRLVCGDSTAETAVATCLDGVAPHLMVTDPPYGVDYDPQWRERAGVNGTGAAKGKVRNDDRADWRAAWSLFPGDVAYVWHGALHAATVAESLESVGFAIRAQIIWDKTRLVLGRGDYHWAHEPCWYGVRKGKAGHWSGDRTQTTVWPIPHLKSETGHGTQKPVECMRRPIANNSSPGQAVYDPFCGSGTTIIAAEMTGRACHAIDSSRPMWTWRCSAGRRSQASRRSTRPAGRHSSRLLPNGACACVQAARRSGRQLRAKARSVAVPLLMEACANVALGFVLALVVQASVYPLFGINTTFLTDGSIAVIFTCVSLVRSYLVRRAFEMFGAQPLGGSRYARP